MDCQSPMRLNAREMNPAWGMFIAVWLAGSAGPGGAWVAVPVHETRGGPVGGFDLGSGEVTAGEFQAYLNETAVADFPETAQIRRKPNGSYAVRRGLGRQAVAEVTWAEAEAYGRWLSRKTGRTVRLPTEAEWEAAARGGVDGAPFPWGWGGPPAAMAQFDAAGPARRGGRFPANGFGLYDMAGNVYEWCASGRGLPAGQAAARGGSWDERDPALLDAGRRQVFPAGYRGRDAGFRVLREWKDK